MYEISESRHREIVAELRERRRGEVSEVKVEAASEDFCCIKAIVFVDWACFMRQPSSLRRFVLVCRH